MMGISLRINRLMTIPPIWETNPSFDRDRYGNIIYYMEPQLIGLYALAWLQILHGDLTIKKIIKCVKLETWELCAI